MIKQYYVDLIKNVDLPVIAYNNPKYSNFCISGDFLAELADIGLEGVKDSSADISLFYDFMAKVKKEGFLFLIGSQTHLLPAVVGGAHGCVSGLSNAFPASSRRSTPSARRASSPRPATCSSRPTCSAA